MLVCFNRIDKQCGSTCSPGGGHHSEVSGTGECSKEVNSRMNACMNVSVHAGMTCRSLTCRVACAPTARQAEDMAGA